MTLRPYQNKFLNEIIGGLRDYRGVMAVAPTGSGKTVVFNQAIRRYLEAIGKKALVLAHRNELLTQCAARLWKAHKIQSSIIQGSRPVRHDLPVFVASVQTLNNRDMPRDIGLIITDEAHHARAATYQQIYEQLPEAHMLGFTATPWRLSGKGFTDTFDTMVQAPGIRELEKMGYLCRAKQFIVPMDHAAFAQAVPVTSTGDFHQKKLGEFMSTDPMIRRAVTSWFHYGEGKQTIAFMSSIEQSVAMVKELRSKGIAAIHIDGGTKKRDRAALLRDFSNGRFKVLCNVGIATEGLDVPSVECVLLGRPTKSLSLYLQMCGRGSRLHGDKDHYNLIDISDNILEHGHPNKDQAWTLEDRDKKAEEQLVRYFRVLLPNGDLVNDVPRHKVPAVPGLKVLETPPPARYKLIEQIARRVQLAGHKKGKVYYDFLRECTRQQPPTEEELLHMAKILRYSRSWVNYKLVSLGIEPSKQAI